MLARKCEMFTSLLACSFIWGLALPRILGGYWEGRTSVLEPLLSRETEETGPGRVQVELQSKGTWEVGVRETAKGPGEHTKQVVCPDGSCKFPSSNLALLHNAGATQGQLFNFSLRQFPRLS